MFGIGSTELLVILVIALLVLGPKNLPKAARTVGKVMGEFRRVSTEFQRTINTEIALEEQKDAQTAQTAQAGAATAPTNTAGPATAPTNTAGPATAPAPTAAPAAAPASADTAAGKTPAAASGVQNAEAAKTEGGTA